MGIQDFKTWWSALSPENKRKYLIGAIVVGIFGMAFVFDKPQERAAQRQVEDEAKNTTALVRPRVRDTSNEALGSELDALNNQVTKQSQTVNEVIRLQSDTKVINEDLKKRVEDYDAMRMELEGLRQEVSVLKSGIGDSGKPLNLPELNTNDMPTGAMPPVPAPKDQTPGAEGFPSVDEANGVIPQGPAKPAKPSLRMISDAAAGAVTSGLADASRTASGLKTSANGQGQQGEAAPTLETFIPAGSILDGVLLTGVDAPANGVGERNPVPGLVRIKADAILPNRFRHDVRECFVLIAGKGVLSTERVEFRTETLSCIRNDGGVIETKIEGYATGEDGKAGLRGRLVSKQGSVLAKSLMAGILSGFGKALTPNTVQSLNLSGGGSTQTEQLGVGEAARIGAYSGVTSAASDLSKFYLDLAKEIFPVLEVDAGRRLNIVLVRGTQLAFGVKRT